MTEHLNERKSERHPLQLDLSTFLLVGEGMLPCRCVGVDVSNEGLGIIGFEPREVNSAATLVIGGKTIKLTVVWMKADSLRQGIFHAGLQAVAGSPSLTDTFVAAGLLTKKATGEGMGVPADQQTRMTDPTRYSFGASRLPFTIRVNADIAGFTAPLLMPSCRDPKSTPGPTRAFAHATIEAKRAATAQPFRGHDTGSRNC